jgi:hypothetical protein
MKDYTEQIQRMREHPEEAPRIMQEIIAEMEADAERLGEQYERIDAEQWREQLADQVADEWIDAVEELRASLTPEDRQHMKSLPLVEEMIRTLAPETRERVSRRRAERGLPPLIGFDGVRE